MGGKDENPQSGRTNIESFIAFLNGQEYLITLAVAGLLLILAAGTELDILGAKAQPSDNNFSRFLLLGGAIFFLVLSWFLRANKNQKESSNQVKKIEQISREIQEVSTQSENISEPERRSLNELEPVLSGLQKNKIIELSLAEWLKESGPKEKWTEQVAAQTAGKFQIKFNNDAHERKFRLDIEEYLNEICHSLETGERPKYARHRSVELMNPYKWALEELKRKILESYKNSTTILEREREKGQFLLSQTIDDLLHYIETTL